MNLSIEVPAAIVAAAERQLARQGVARNSRHRQKLAELLKQWIARGLLLEAGEANKREAIAQAVDRINARDAGEGCPRCGGDLERHDRGGRRRMECARCGCGRPATAAEVAP